MPERHDTTVVKVDAATAPQDPSGFRYLASGVSLSMRLWVEEQPGSKSRIEPHARDYETIGFVINGRAELHLEGQMVLLEAGHSWVVPRGASHHFKILEPFTAVEATHPPYQVHGRSA